jgi:MFS family permease
MSQGNCNQHLRLALVTHFMLTRFWNHLVKDYKDIHTGVKFLVLVIFLRSMGWGFADPFFSIYLDQFTHNYALIGLLTSLVAFTALLSIVPLMRLSDVIQETVVIQDGETLYLFVVLSYVFAGLLHSLPLLIFALALNGIAQTFVVVGTEAYIRRNDGQGKSGPFGFYVAMDYFGWILGMLIASFAVAYYSLNMMFLFILPSIFLAFFILPRIHEEGVRSLIDGFRHYFHNRQDFVELFMDFKTINPKIFFFLVLAFFDGVIRMFAYVFIPLFAVSLHLGLKSIAILSVVMYTPFIFSYFFSELSDVVNKMKVIAFGLFIGALSFILLHFVVSQWWVIGLSAAVSLSMAIIRPAYNGVITRLTPHGKMGEITGIYNFVDRVGRIVGPILTGLIADHFGLQTTFLVMAFVALLLGFLSLGLRANAEPDPDQVY